MAAKKTKELTTYRHLSTAYYDLKWAVAPVEELHFYRSYAAEAQGMILEPMCGSGRFLVPLCAEGYEIQGFDASSAMLQSLAERCQSQALCPVVWQQFIQDFDSPERYALIIIPSCSFCLITDRDEARRCLGVLYRHLQPGGKLVIELETYAGIPEQFHKWRSSRQDRSDGTYIALYAKDLPLRDGIGTTIRRYELVSKGKTIQSETEHFKLRLYQPQEFVDVLIAVGFRDVRQVKAFDRNQQPDAHDAIVVFEGTK